MFRSTAAISPRTITTMMIALAVITGGFTAGSAHQVAGHAGTAAVVSTSPSQQPDSDGHGWIN